MKNQLMLTLLALTALTITSTFSSRAAESNAPPERVGVYDSRVLAYADFWSEPRQRKLADQTREAKAARDAGDTNRFQKLDATLKQERERAHLQVFSTAPVDEILAGMKDRIAEIQKEAGVSALVSRWDEKALREHKGAAQVDVTDRLLRDFKLDEKQKKVIDEMNRQSPLPLDKAQELMRQGKL